MLQFLAMLVARFVPAVDGYKTIIGLLLTGGVAAVEQAFGVQLPDWLQMLGLSITGVGGAHKVMKAQSFAALEGPHSEPVLEAAIEPLHLLGRLKEWSTWAALASLGAIIFGGDAPTWQAAFKQVFDSTELLIGAAANLLALFESHPKKGAAQ